jgi:hypothetical protein
MATVNLNGRMESSILASLKTTNVKAKVLSPGEMVVYMKVIGVMVNSMVKVCLLNLMALKELVYGRMVETLSG